MAGQNGFDIKMFITNLPDFTNAIKEMNDALSKDFTPLVKTLAGSIKDLKKIDHNTVQAIQAQNNGISVGRNKTIVNDEIMNWAVQDSRRMKKLQSMIEKAQEDQLRIIEEENKYRLDVLKERKRENDHAKWSEDYRDRALQFKKDVAMGKYDESRSFKEGFRGYFAQRLYQNSKEMASGRGAINSFASSIAAQVFGPTLGKYIGESLVGSMGKALRRRANVMEFDDNGKEIGPKYAIGKFSRYLTKGGTLSGEGVNAAGGLIGLASQVAISGISAWKHFEEGLIEAASGLEKLTAQLNVVTGSQGSAYKTFSTIKDYAFNSPYTTTETTQTAVLLRQSGVLESKLDSTIRMLGDLGMGDQERLNRISNNYSQILAAGRANSKDLREFANAGIPIYKALLEYFQKDPNVEIGNTTEAVRKLAEEGKVTSQVITRVFENLTGPGGTFNGASSTYAKTYAGQMNNLQDRLNVARGNAINLNGSFWGNRKKDWLNTRIWWYEATNPETKVLDRMIGKLDNREDIKELGALRILADKKLRNKEIVSDEDFEKLSKEEKKFSISITDYYKTLQDINKNLTGKGKLNNNSSAVTYFEGFYESVAKSYAQSASDYFLGLYQDNTTFAHQLSSSDTTYKEKSEYAKVEKAIKERKKYTDLIKQYDIYEKLYDEDITDYTSKWNKGGIGVKSFSELYDFISSGFLGNTGKINISYDKKLFSQENANELKKNFRMFELGINQGFLQYGDAYGIEELYDQVIDAVEDVDVNKGKTVHKLTTSIEKFKTKVKVLKDDDKVSDEYKKFLGELEQIFSFSFLSGYSKNEAPKDYTESFKLRTLRNSSGLDALNGNTVQKNLDEILRKQNKTISTSTFRNQLKNSTLADLVASGDLRYTGRKNELGGMKVDFEEMGKSLEGRFTDMSTTVSNLNVNLHDYANYMKGYTDDIRKQIDLYTQLEETLQLGEDKLADAFYNMDTAQKSSLTAYGKVKTASGEEYSDLRFDENGVLQANIQKKGKRGQLIDDWQDVIGNSDLTLVLDDLTEQIRSSKTDLLLLESRLKENTLVLTKINVIRDQGNSRRFDKILNNTNYLTQKGFTADKGSAFYKDFNNVISSLYSEYMSLSLPNLIAGSEAEQKEIAKNFKDGRYTYSDLRNIQNLQSQSAYRDGQWILSQLELILGDKFKLVIDELKKSQTTYDDEVGWKRLLASTTGLSYDTVKSKGSSGTIDIYGKLQSRDILKSTMLGLGRSGGTMGDMSNLGVKLADGTYTWNKTRANLFNNAVAGTFNLETLSGLKSGLESSRDAIIDLQATLLTATDTTSENNKQITDVLSTLFTGNKLTGILDSEAVTLEQFLKADGTYGFRKAGTEEVVDTLADSFTFDKEATTKSLEELANITNSTLSTVKLLETMKASIKAIEDDTRELKIKNFGNLGNTPFANGNNNTFFSTGDSKSFIGYATSAYNNARNTFINSALEIAKMNENSDMKVIEDSIKSFNDKNNTDLKSENIVDIIKTSKLLKAAIDTGESAEEIARILTLLGFDKDSLITNASIAYGEQGILSERYSSYDELANSFSYFANKKYGTPLSSSGERYNSILYGVSNYKSAIQSIATTEDIDDESALTELKKAVALRDMEGLQDKLTDMFKNHGLDTFNKALQTTGECFREITDGITEGEESWKRFGKAFVESTRQITANIGENFVAAGLRQLMFGETGTGIALLLAGGASQIVSGFMKANDDNEADKKIETLKALKADLKELIAQAKADAIYYEKEVSHKKALTTNQAMTNVNDAIITPSGNVINTHPDDWLIATKTPQTLGNNKSSAPVVNLNIVNNSGQQLSVKKTQTTSNGEINIEAIIEGVVGKGIAEGKFDNALNTRDMRNAGRSVYM